MLFLSLRNGETMRNAEVWMQMRALFSDHADRKLE